MNTLKKIAFLSILVYFSFIGFLYPQDTPINTIEQIDPGVSGKGDFGGDEYPITPTITLPSLPDREIDLKGYMTIPKNANGSFPVVVLLHGRHNICYVSEGTDGFLTTNCGDSFGKESNEIPNYQGFRYIANTLASHGYVVTTIDSNPIIDVVERDKQAAIEAAGSPFLSNYGKFLKIKDEGAQLRAELIQEHLNLLKRFNSDPDIQLDGLSTLNTMDFKNVVTMGHSIGGEGVVKHFIHNKNLGSPYTIKGVFAVAPSNANNFIVSKGMNYAVMLPYCDGDLTNLPGVWAYDRQTENSDSGTHQVLVLGANHNNFNFFWTPGNFIAGTFDDWTNLEAKITKNNDDGKIHVDGFCGKPNNRISPQTQRNVLTTYLHSFIKTYVDKDFRYSTPILGSSKEIPASLDLQNNFVHVSYQAPLNKRMDLNLVENSNIIINDGLRSFDVCGTSNQEHLCGEFEQESNKFLDDHFSANHNTGLARILVSWNDTDKSKMAYNVDPKQKDVSAYTHFTFRAGVTAFPPFQINRNGGFQNFTITITDNNLKKVSVEAGSHSNALYQPPGTSGNITPHNIANAITIPLSAFESIDFKNIQTIAFEFNKTNKGEIYFSDFAFTNLEENQKDTEVPTAPTELSASNITQTTVDLSWKAATDNIAVTAYDVYQDDEVITTVTDLTFQVTGLDPTTEYSFKVLAKDDADNQSEFSNTTSITTLEGKDTENPTPPTDLSVSNITQTTVDLSWQAATDNTAVVVYEVYQGDKPIASVADLTFQVTGLDPATEYSFKVLAKDDADNQSEFSNTTSITTLEEVKDIENPTAPTELSASNITQTTVDLLWKAATDNIAVTAYEIYQGEEIIATVTDLTYQVTGLDPATEYSFKVLAKDAAENTSEFSNTTSITTLEEVKDIENPTAPTELSASNITQTTVDLLWKAAIDNIAVTAYEIYQGEEIIATVTDLTYQVEGLDPDTEYSFNVAAKDEAGNISKRSTTVSITTKSKNTGNICDGIADWKWNIDYKIGDRAIIGKSLLEKTASGWKYIGRCNSTPNPCFEVDVWNSEVTYTYGDRAIYYGSLWRLNNRGWTYVTYCPSYGYGPKSSNIAPPQKLSISPNPVNGNILNVTLNASEDATYGIINMLGKVVAQGNYQSSVDVSNVPVGIYLLRVVSNKTAQTARFVKQ